jgi:hypothetical protein
MEKYFCIPETDKALQKAEVARIGGKKGKPFF